MTGKDILEQIKVQRRDDHRFIAWWRKEQDWLDYDLLDTYLENLGPDEEIGGFDLLTIEEMWENLKKAAPGRVERDTRRGEEVIVWRRIAGEEQVCPFIAASVMTIFNVETHGDNVD